MEKKKIYLAGGWFTPEMEEEHNRIYWLIKEYYDVFNPKLASLITKDSTADDMTQTLIGNIEGIKNADVVVVIYDRKDTGTIWEAGCAYALGKPIVYYAETLGDKPFNLMLAKTGRFASSMIELAQILSEDSTYIYKSVYHDYKGDVE